MDIIVREGRNRKLEEIVVTASDLATADKGKIASGDLGIFALGRGDFGVLSAAFVT